MNKNYSFIIPVYNEENSIIKVVEAIKKTNVEKEIIIIDDCSTDNTKKICETIENIKYLRSLQNFGYGHCIKKGIENSKFENLVILDGDNTYPLDKFDKLKERYEEGYDMVVGKRVGKNLNLSPFKGFLRTILKIIVEFSTGEKIPDINSGFRIFKKNIINKYLYIMCDTFSFSTSMTLTFIFLKKTISYVDIPYKNRIGTSKVKLFRDSLRTLQYISEILLYFNPLKFYLIVSFLLFIIFFVFLMIFGIKQPYFNIGLVFLLSSIISILFGFSKNQKNEK